MPGGTGRHAGRPTVRLARCRGAAALVVLSLAAAACGGGGKKAATGPTATTQAEGTPKVGGTLVMGTEAEIDGFDPAKNRWDLTGLMYGLTVYDPLTAFAKDGQPHPYLAQSVDHNADYTEWTIKLRPGVQFSNGDPLTADDVVYDLTAYKNAPLTGRALDPVASITKVDDLTVLVKMNEPWVVYPQYLAGQIGVIPSPKTLKDPNGSRNPIGTGPFVLKEWVPGSHFIAVRNPHYWRPGLPYLDSVEYRPIVDPQSRESSLVSGTVDVIHTDDTQSIVDLRHASGINLLDDSRSPGRHEKGFVMLNTAAPPLDDLRVRQALAYATDRKRYRDVIDNGITADATSPFESGSPFSTASGYPDYDLAKAKQLVAQYGKPISFELGTVNSAKSLAGAQLLQDMWKAAGITVTIKQTEQSPYILNALLGKYQANGWRQFGEPDPDADYVWWVSQNALPVGQLALNFSRNKDPQVDADLQKGRSSPDPAVRQAAYQDIARRFGQDLPFIWLDVTVWGVASKPRVHGVVTSKLPDGSEGLDYLVGGGFLMTHVWVS